MSLKDHIKRPSPAMVVALAALVVAAGGVAAASIPASDGTISACYAKNLGDLRVIDPSTGAKCRSGEKSLTWSQTGPRGPAGTFGTVTARGGSVNFADGSTATADAYCQANETAVGGGGAMFGGDRGSSTIVESLPLTDGFDPFETNGGVNSADEWQVTMVNHSGGERELDVYVLCVPIPS